jgi:hypothetical protein
MRVGLKVSLKEVPKNKIKSDSEDFFSNFGVGMTHGSR